MNTDVDRGGRVVGPDAGLDPCLHALTESIIGAAFAVSNTLGHGFLEAVYKNALAEEVLARGLSVVRETPFDIHYRGVKVGRYIADLVVEQSVIVELKAVELLSTAHTLQLLNYLKASSLPVGLLMNFGKPRIEFKRVLNTTPARNSPDRTKTL